MSESPAQEFEWLTIEYIETVLQQFSKDNTLRVIGLYCQPATAKGDNHVSILTRIHVPFQIGQNKESESKICLVMKTKKKSDAFVADMTRHIFDVEMEMYERVLPRLSELLLQSGDDDKLFATCLYVDREHEAIIFEDLFIWDFVTADRVTGVDLSLAHMAMRKLAKMHATAAVLNERTRGSLQKFDYGIMNKYTSGYFENMTAECAQFADSGVGLGPYYKEKLLKLQPHIVNSYHRSQSVREHEFNTLNHGNCWTNNVMMRYIDEPVSNGYTVSDMVLIDFQFCKWGSPTLDLNYFFKTSLPIELIKHQEERLVHRYHQVLKDTLFFLDYKGHIPTLHELTVQMEKTKIQALIVVLGARALLTNDNPTEAGYQTMLLDDEAGRRFRRSLYERKPHQEVMKYLLPYFDHRGILDIAECD